MLTLDDLILSPLSERLLETENGFIRLVICFDITNIFSYAL